MKKYFLFLLLIVSIDSKAQQVDHFFQHIRNNPAELTAFFAKMPKGGDLHHHYSGSIYAETYIRWVINKNYFINKKNLEISDRIPNRDIMWKSFSELAKTKQLDSIKSVLIQKWSVKNYNGVDPPDKLFFQTFGNFNLASQLNIDSGLLEIKDRARAENVGYIETMISAVSTPINTFDLSTQYNAQLQRLNSFRDYPETKNVLTNLYSKFISRHIDGSVNDFCDELAKRHTSLRLDDSAFILRYQTYVNRLLAPADFFKSLILAFEAANRSPLIVGVNILGAENNEVSMQDYWLHMQMFKFCHDKYPNVKYAMHAGELCLGMVKPEELNWHIGAAVYEAGAMRIGHGVDMPYERNAYELMNYMREKHIPVEINLYSNEFILKIKGDRHPVTLYKKQGVPIIICTDDPGVLRTNLTDQYVLLASRYPEFSYIDIKKIVYNSINFSFIKEPAVKQLLIKKLNKKFQKFEQEIVNISKRKEY